MNQNEFDKILKQKMLNDDIPISPQWDTMKRMLENENISHKKVIPFYMNKSFKMWSAAAVLIIMLGGIGLWATKKPVPSEYDSQTASIAEQQQPETPSNTIESIEEDEKGVVVAAYVRNEKTTTNTNQKIIQQFDKNSIQESKVIHTETESKGLIAKELHKDTETIYQDRRLNEREALNQLQQIKESYNIKNQPNYATNKANVGAIGVSSGYNVGNMQQGMNLSVNGTVNINDKVFIEGAIAYQSNNESDNYSSKLKNTNYTSRKGTVAAFASPAISKKTEEMRYVQINPSVGYQLNDNISVSFGADMQNLITDSDDKTLVLNKHTSEWQEIPKIDIGMTTKTEFKLTKNIKAGIQFRNGLNNLFIKNKDMLYANRQYLQIHLKYNLIFKKEIQSKIEN